MNIKKYTIENEVCIPFSNQVDFCIGTGRMGLALQQAYQEQLQLIQDIIGFQYIRGHGLFSDDMAIYNEYKKENGNTEVEYNFTYLDMVIDSYIAKGIKPFLELGFMPEKLASGYQTVFYWKGNVTPPKEYKKWEELVQATLIHLVERYGDDVYEWPIEVWNEPNLEGFWKDADKEEYFHLFSKTYKAVKRVDKRFKIGGPAICGVKDKEWLNDFLSFCKYEKLDIDFVTRHHYTIDVPETCGHYTYVSVRDYKTILQELEESRTIIDSFRDYQGLPMHITEFNTSYSPDSPIHDTNLNAAYIAGMLANLGDTSASYSYWTFGDIFEEKGVPFTPFHGGFGLVANGLIPKPTFWVFAFLKKLVGNCVLRTQECVIVQKDSGKYCGIAWNICVENEINRMDVVLQFPSKKGKQYYLLEKIVDERVCNPLKIWHDIGEPANPTKEENELIRQGAIPLLQTKRLTVKGDQLEICISLTRNAVVYFEIQENCIKSDRGYDYERII